jgi:hypothetical protein
MGRKHRRGRTKAAGHGMMSSMRGGFRSVVRGGPAPAEPTRRWTPGRIILNVLTIAMLALAAAVILGRFGVL